jgi:hypothetical protein
VPNIHLGKWGERNAIRILFPRLWHSGRANVHLSAEEQKDLYEKGILPAVEALGEDTAHWPATYRDENWRARRINDGSSFRVPLSEWCIPLFGDRLREELKTHHVEWADGLKFLHDVRGVARPEGHHSTALARFLTAVNLSSILNDDANASDSDDDDDDNWWIDVGLEISCPQYCLEWRTASHASVVERVLQITPQHSREITSLGNSNYSLDTSSHLVDVAGCRIEFGGRSCGPYNATFFRMYTTNKSPHDPQGYFHGKAVKGRDILKAEAAPAFCQELYDGYVKSAQRHDSNARVEVRVPPRSSFRVFRSFPDALIRDSLLAFPRVAWW